MEGVGVLSEEMAGGDDFPQCVKHSGTRLITVIKTAEEKRNRRNIGGLRVEIAKFINIAD